MLELIWKKAKEEIITRRRAICAACPSIRKTPAVGYTCGRFLIPNFTKGKQTCGCIIQEKTRLKNFSCPRNKWGKEK